ncbi:MAG: bifunctional riboflavin kinase/FAD synthetase, partial [SAR202 cluster bacterium]|nr:bifunctional riboflavin kinase/FAD synthetase [SAR202 cluster bacterium]
LGFPTANLRPADGMMTPRDGIYAAWAHVGGERYMAATNIGTNPTFGDRRRSIEPYLLDFSGDLYGKRLALEFVKRLRDEVKFDRVEDLQRQVDVDVEQTKTILGARR